MAGESNTRPIMNLGNSIVGVSILAMPYCFSQCGIVLGTLLLISCTFFTTWSCKMLMRAAVMTHSHSYENLALGVFGRPGKLLTEVSVIGLNLGTCIAFFVIIGDLAPPIVAQATGINWSPTVLRAVVLVMAAVCIAFPLGLLRSVDSLSGISMCSLLFYASLTLQLMFLSSNHLLSRTWFSHVTWWDNSGLLKCIPIFALAFACQTQLFIIYGDLHDPGFRRIATIINGATLSIFILYFLVAMFGCISFHAVEIKGDILSNFDIGIMSQISRLGFSLSVVVSFPLMIFPCRVSINSLFFSSKSLELHVREPIPQNRFVAITAFIILSTLFVAILIPNVETILGLTGATMGTLISFILPSVIFLKVAGSSADYSNKAKVCVVVGFVVMLLSTAVIIQSEINNHTITVQKAKHPPFKVPPPPIHGPIGPGDGPAKDRPHHPNAPPVLQAPGLPRQPEKPERLSDQQDKLPDRPVDRPQDHQVRPPDQPVNRPQDYQDRPPDRPVDRLQDRQDRPPDRPVQDRQDRPPDRPVQDRQDSPPDRPIDRLQDHQDRPPDQPVDRPSDQPADHQPNHHNRPADQQQDPRDRAHQMNPPLGAVRDQRETVPSPSPLVHEKGEGQLIHKQLQEDMSQLSARLNQLEKENKNLKERQEVFEQIQVDDLLQKQRIVEEKGGGVVKERGQQDHGLRKGLKGGGGGGGGIHQDHKGGAQQRGVPGPAEDLHAGGATHHGAGDSDALISPSGVVAKGRTETPAATIPHEATKHAPQDGDERNRRDINHLGAQQMGSNQEAQQVGSNQGAQQVGTDLMPVDHKGRSISHEQDDEGQQRQGVLPHVTTVTPAIHEPNPQNQIKAPQDVHEKQNLTVKSIQRELKSIQLT